MNNDMHALYPPPHYRVREPRAGMNNACTPIQVETCGKYYKDTLIHMQACPDNYKIDECKSHPEVRFSPVVSFACGESHRSDYTIVPVAVVLTVTATIAYTSMATVTVTVTVTVMIMVTVTIVAQLRSQLQMHLVLRLRVQGIPSESRTCTMKHTGSPASTDDMPRPGPYPTHRDPCRG